MTVDPRTTSLDLPVEWTHLSEDAVAAMNAAMGAAYLATYRGPHAGAPTIDDADTGPLIEVTPDALVPTCADRRAGAARARQARR